MSVVNLDTYDNSWYKQKNFFIRLLWYFVNSFFFNTQLLIPQKFKTILLKTFGCEVGLNVVIKPSVNIKYPWLLSIADNVWIGENVWIDNLAFTTIERNVCVSQGAMLLCGNHNYNKSSFNLIVKPIKLEEGSWVGAKSIVCPGVTLFSHSILSVGSVANKDLAPFTIYQGNPAVKIRERKIQK